MFKKCAAVFAICLTLAGCGISQETYDQTATERDALATQVAELQTENDALTAQVAKLQNENNTLSSQNTAWSSENAALSSENASLKAKPAAEPAPAAAEAAPASAAVASSESSSALTSTEQYTYIGNINSYKFHRKSCSTLPAEKNRVYYATRDEAKNNGMVPCKRCNP